ncbi:MAG: amidohydrolase family protein, partial [Planctomycetia bacterium]
LLNEKIAEANKPGLYRDVLEKKARIDLAIVDRNSITPISGFIAQVKRFDNFVNIRNAKDLANLEKYAGTKFNSLDDLCGALAINFEKQVKTGIVGIKSALAYNRRIYYPLPTEDQAKAAFEKLKSGKPVSNADVLPLQNYMMHQVCKLADKHDMPFQFHTGLQTGTGNTITNSKPTDLVNLISKYPNVKFVIFHGSYPYGHELSTIAKNFQNAYIDMCWLHVISPKISRDSLSEWLETVPANKITAFGGDYGFPEGTYAHAEMGREVVAEVLAEKVLRGYCTEAEACELAVKLLRNNAIDIYKLKLEKAPSPKGGEADTASPKDKG